MIGSKHENTRSPYVFIGCSNKDPVGTRDDGRQTHPKARRPFRARVAQIYEIERPFRARGVQINEMKTRQALTFLTVSRPKCATVLRFCNTDVRKIYENRRRFRARVAQIYKMKTREALTFLTVRKMKKREALTFLTVFNQK